LIFIVFRSYSKYKVDNHSAIVVNYFTAGVLGLIINGSFISPNQFIEAPWAINGVILGTLFIIIFNVMALTTQKLGASVSSIATKMALVVPVVFAVIQYGDEINTLKVSGIILALLGIYLSTVKTKKVKQAKDKSLYLLPIILFLGSGFLDTFIKYTQNYHLNASGEDDKIFTSTIFLTAFCVGFIYVLFKKRNAFLQPKNLLGGFVLGVINYGSIYFLIQTLSLENWESSVVFPMNNMGIVLLTTFASVMLFNENLSKTNKFGVFISLLAILSISLA
jgi:drug/metabolite transporter (DMT)-like permease